MAEVGFDFTHFGEFAWAFIEPEEGRFDFKWLDEAVDLAQQNGIKVVMCTSSPTPPAWLAEKHPEILMVNDNGTVMQHGSRQQISWLSPIYRQYVEKMVEAVGKHFANDKRIWGWQLDNEPSHYGQYDYSPAAQQSFRFKQPLTGGEQYHYGILGTDGLTPSTSGTEYMRVIREMKELKKSYNPDAALPAAYRARQAAILYNPDNRWETDNQPQTFQWDFMQHLMRYYGALKQCGAPVDVITEAKDFTPYAVMVAPCYELLDAKLVERWKQYVQNGGHLVLTSRTGQKNRNGKLWEMKWAEPVYDLIGASIPFYDLLPDTVNGAIRWGAQRFTWNNWADILQPGQGTEVWATYGNQFYAGRAAVTSRKLGKGTVTYVGPDTDDGSLEKAVLRKVYQQAGISIMDLPRGG